MSYNTFFPDCLSQLLGYAGAEYPYAGRYDADTRIKVLKDRLKAERRYKSMESREKGVVERERGLAEREREVAERERVMSGGLGRGLRGAEEDSGGL